MRKVEVYYYNSATKYVFFVKIMFKIGSVRYILSSTSFLSFERRKYI